MRVAEIAHPTTVARLIGRSAFSGIVCFNFLRAEIPTAHSSKLVCAFVKPILSLRYRPDRCGSPCERVLAADDAAVLDHALHADNTRVDRGNPAIAVLSIGYQPPGSCSRAAGWSAATLCFGPNAKCRRALNLSAFRGIPEVMAHVQSSGGISKLNLDGMLLIDSLCGKFLSSSQLLTHPPRQGVRSIAMAEATLFRKASCAYS